MLEREIRDFDQNGTLLYRIGKVSFPKAKCPLEVHNHGSYTEFVFMIRGRQHYQVGDTVYTVNGGENFTAFPGEEHGSGGRPEEKTFFYYLIVDLPTLAKRGELGFGEEIAALWEALKDRTKRVRKSESWYGDTCEKLFALCKENTSFRETKMRNLLSALLVSMAEQRQMERCPQEKTAEQRRGLERTGRFREVLSYIEIHIREEMTMGELADLAGLSESRFKRLFQEEIGIPPREYILRQKLEHCKAELEHSGKSVTEIALDYGFSSGQYFSTVFKRYYYQTPSEFREGKRLPAKSVHATL